MEKFYNIEEQKLWNQPHMWEDGGHEWSGPFGNTENLWNKEIFDTIKEFRGKKILEIITPRDCYNILRNVSDEDCYLLGFNPKMQRPEDMIIVTFPIPPVIIRPTSKIDFMSAVTMEDGLTLMISDIININKRVRKQKESGANEGSNYEQDIFNSLQLNIINYFDNDVVSLPRSEFKTGGRVVSSISDRIKGKTGRVRSNLMGNGAGWVCV